MKKISRKDLSAMSAAELFEASKAPYRKLLAYLRPYKFRFFLGLGFAALFGALNGAIVWVTKYVAEQFLDKDTAQDLPVSDIILIGLAIPGIMLVRSVCAFLNEYLMTWVGLRVLDDMRKDAFSSLMKQSLDYFGKKKSGELIQTVFNQTRMIQQALIQIASDLTKAPISIVALVISLFLIDWKFAIGALFLFPLCILPVVFIGRKVRKSGAKEEEEAGMLMVVMQEAFSGVSVVKSHAREDYEMQKFASANKKMLNFIMRWRKAMAIVGPLVETVASLGIAAAMVYVALHPDLKASDFIVLNGALVLLYPPAKTLSRMHVLVQKCLAATTKVFEMIETEPTIKDKDDAIVLKTRDAQITFENVTFTYGKSTELPAVSGIDLKIAQGKTHALVGHSGAGKTTMLALLLRFYDPQEGAVRINGIDIRDLTQSSLRDHIGVVNQDTFLFHDTIFENIRYGRLDAQPEEIIEAAKHAFAHEFIEEQPKGYETVIGDKGCLLSGGQKQRLSIARAILRNAPILLLDEAMSALDTESEKKVQAAIDDLSSGKTVIAIAHRLSTILEADQIVVMDKGRICAVGTHAELLAKSPIYENLYNLQYKPAEA